MFDSCVQNALEFLSHVGSLLGFLLYSRRQVYGGGSLDGLGLVISDVFSHDGQEVDGADDNMKVPFLLVSHAFLLGCERYLVI